MNGLRGSVVQVNVSPGGMPKRPVPEIYVTPHGVQGDRQAHTNVHGGPEKAVLIVASETVDEMSARGYPLFYGALGENITTRGLDRRAVRIGQRLRAGEAVLEITKLRGPCSQLDIYGADLKEAIKASEPSEAAYGLSGFYARVLQPGWVRPEDVIWVVDQAV